MEPTREQAYRRRIAQLEAENSRLKAEVAALKAEVARAGGAGGQAVQELLELLQAAVERHRQTIEGAVFEAEESPQEETQDRSLP